MACSSASDQIYLDQRLLIIFGTDHHLHGFSRARFVKPSAVALLKSLELLTKPISPYVSIYNKRHANFTVAILRLAL